MKSGFYSERIVSLVNEWNRKGKASELTLALAKGENAK